MLPTSNIALAGLKAMTDGRNHTSSFLYNAKLQPTHFDISGDLVNQNYDYYNDGRISFVDNTTDAKFDRAYSYDHMARLTRQRPADRRAVTREIRLITNFPTMTP